MVESPLTEKEAVNVLEQRSGSTILCEEVAKDVAQAFGVEDSINCRPISDMDRLQPDNDNLGIGIGSLTADIVDGIGMEAERPTWTGHARTQRAYKEENLSKLWLRANA